MYWLCYEGALRRAERVNTLFNGLVVLVLIQHGQVLLEEEALFERLLQFMMVALVHHFIDFLYLDLFVLVLLEIVVITFTVLVELLLLPIVHANLARINVIDHRFDHLTRRLLLVHYDEMIVFGYSLLSKTC